MNLDLLFAIVFYGALILFFYTHKKNLQVQGKIVALYRTKIGLNLMDKIAKKNRNTVILGVILLVIGLILSITGIATSNPYVTGIGSILVLSSIILIIPLSWTGTIGVIIGFIGMVFIFYWLIKGTFDLFFVPSAPPAVAPVLPGVKVIPGLPVLSFWHWIIAIFFVAVVHEFSHGIFARLYRTKVKSSGIALFGPILGAFVEPDEKELGKKSARVQLSVFAAGPFSNMVFGVLFLLLFNFVFTPLYGAVYMGDGIKVNEITPNYPAANANIPVPFIIQGINDKETLNLTSFLEETKNIHPGDTIKLNTDKGEFTLTTVENPDNKTRAFIGVTGLELNKKVRESITAKYGNFIPTAFTWVHMLVFWLVIVNLGVGLFNLLPLGPVDGGRMFLTGMLAIFSEKKAKKIWTFATFLCLALIFVNLAPYLWKLVLFLFKPLIVIFGV